MKDIDFDELDRAVNSLIGPQKQGAVVQTQTAVVDNSTTKISPDAAIVSTDNNNTQNSAPIVAAAPVSAASNSVSSDQTNKSTENTKYVPVFYPARPRPLITTPINPPKPMPVNTFESLASKRSSGRFVDVVNPSANVQMSARVEQVPASVQTAAVLEQPVQINPVVDTSTGSSNLQNTAFSATPVFSTTPVAPVSPVSSATPVAPINPALFQVPVAPIATPENTIAAPVSSVENEDDDIEQISNFINETMSAGSNQKAQESPFLADSKVDKRPLGVGMFAPQPAAIASQPIVQPQVVAQIPQTQQVINSVNTQPRQVPIAQVAPAANFNNNSQLPPELQNDLLSIESDTMPDITPSQIVEMPVSTPIAPVQVPTIAVQPGQINPTTAQFNNMSQSISIAPVIAPSQNAALQATAPQPVMQTSIPQQYQERPKVVDHTTTPIYDANAYHKIDSRGTKKSPLVWLFWVLGLIVIGAGVGVIAYFFILPNL